jgi:hypothetical protein
MHTRLESGLKKRFNGSFIQPPRQARDYLDTCHIT